MYGIANYVLVKKYFEKSVILRNIPMRKSLILYLAAPLRTTYKAYL